MSEVISGAGVVISGSAGGSMNAIRYTKDSGNYVDRYFRSIWWKLCNPYFCRLAPSDWGVPVNRPQDIDPTLVIGSDYAIGNYRGFFIYKSEDDCKADLIPNLENYIFKLTPNSTPGDVYNTSALCNLWFTNISTPDFTKLSNAKFAMLQDGALLAVQDANISWLYKTKFAGPPHSVTTNSDSPLTVDSNLILNNFGDFYGAEPPDGDTGHWGGTPDFDSQISNTSVAIGNFLKTVTPEILHGADILTQFVTDPDDPEQQTNVTKLTNYAGNEIFYLNASFDPKDNEPGTYAFTVAQDWDNTNHDHTHDFLQYQTVKLTVDGQDYLVTNPSNKQAIFYEVLKFIFFIGQGRVAKFLEGEPLSGPFVKGITQGNFEKGSIAVIETEAGARFTLGQIYAIENADPAIMALDVAKFPAFMDERMLKAVRKLDDIGMDWRKYGMYWDDITQELHSDLQQKALFSKEVRATLITLGKTEEEKIAYVQAFGEVIKQQHNVSNLLAPIIMLRDIQMTMPEVFMQQRLLQLQELPLKLQEQGGPSILPYLNPEKFNTNPPPIIQ